jgi:hypothetical protein
VVPIAIIARIAFRHPEASFPEEAVMKRMARRLRERSVWTAYALCALAPAARAQVISGRVLGKSDRVAVPGVIVSLLDSSGRAVETSLVGDSGAFRFTAPAAGSYALRAERVGLHSVTTPAFAVRQGATVELPIMMEAGGVSLRAVNVNADRRCLVRPQEGLATAQLWDEARKALNATQVTQFVQAGAKARRDPHRFAVRWRKFKRDLEPTTLTLRRNEQVELEGETVTPFVSADPERLARDGYLAGEIDRQGTLFAPDAAILLSDRFLDTHCFRVQAPDRGRQDDLIGLAFEPVGLTSDRERKRVEVRGVLWLDRGTAELRYLEYGYVNLPFDADADRAGGRLEFRPFPDGRWIVWRWYIRTPAIERRRSTINSQSSDWQTNIAWVREDGAELLEVMPAGTVRKVNGRVHGMVIDSLRRERMGSVRVFLSGTSHAAITNSDGSYAIDSIEPGAYRVSIVAPGLDSLLIDPPTQEFTVSAGEQKQIDLAVPSFAALSAKLCGAGVADSMAIVVGVVRDAAGTKTLGTTVRADWTDLSRLSTGTLLAQPLSVEGITRAGGRYTLCALRPRTRLKVRARQGRASSTTSELTLQEGEVRRFDLTLRSP